MTIMLVVMRLPGWGSAPPPNLPRSASGAPAGPLRRPIRHRARHRRRTHPSGASGIDSEAISRPA
eukprot:3311811-Alexandrium_andersonii.AAC.1